MAKTRRVKRNKSPETIFGRHVKVMVAERGMGVKVAGYRAGGGQVAAKGEKAKPVFIGRQYTGENKGRTYPYASKKRAGAEFVPTPKKTVMVSDVAR